MKKIFLKRNRQIGFEIHLRHLSAIFVEAVNDNSSHFSWHRALRHFSNIFIVVCCCARDEHFMLEHQSFLHWLGHSSIDIIISPPSIFVCDCDLHLIFLCFAQQSTHNKPKIECNERSMNSNRILWLCNAKLIYLLHFPTQRWRSTKKTWQHGAREEKTKKPKTYTSNVRKNLQRYLHWKKREFKVKLFCSLAIHLNRKNDFSVSMALYTTSASSALWNFVVRWTRMLEPGWQLWWNR